MNFFEQQAKQERESIKQGNKCEHRNKSVSSSRVVCMSCGKVLADNKKDAEKYYA